MVHRIYAADYRGSLGGERRQADFVGEEGDWGARGFADMAGIHAAGDAGHAGGKFPERSAIGKDRAHQARAGGRAGHGASCGCSGAGVDADGRAEGGACGGEARAGAETGCALGWAVIYAVEAACRAFALVRCANGGKPSAVLRYLDS